MPSLSVHFPLMNDAAILNIFAIAYLAIGIGGIAEKSMMKNLLRDFEQNRALSFVAGLLAIALGYAIAITHAHADTTEGVIVAVLGWISLTKGFLIIAVPKWSYDVADAFVKTKIFSKVFPYLAIALSFAIFSITL
ncbi:MAG: hypothetical protein QG650_354 [Patescibacteria group bacterium]|nr:hypothetical protein [Patescibacteria group bacterium]